MDKVDYELFPSEEGSLENVFRATRRIFSSKTFWLNIIALSGGFLVGFISKLGMSKVDFNISRYLLGLAKVSILSFSFTLLGILTVFFYEYFYLKSFRFKGKYFLVEKYLWALVLPFSFSLIIQMHLELKFYIPSVLVMSLIISLGLTILAFKKGEGSKLLLALNVPVTFGVFSVYGIALILWISYVAKFITSAFS